MSQWFLSYIVFIVAVPFLRIPFTIYDLSLYGSWREKEAFNRLFNRYGGHIELIRFKEYYRMPGGHEHISFVFSSAFRDIFS